MRIFITALILIIRLQSWTKADDIKDFEIVGINPDVVIISPEPGSRIRGRDCLISLAYFSDMDIDPFKTIKAINFCDW